MTGPRRRRRALVLLLLAVACGGLAASHVQSREQQVERALGPLVPVLVTRSDVGSGGRLKRGQLAVRQVPERFAPGDALSSADQVAGRRVANRLPPGSYVTAAVLDAGGAGDAPGSPIRRGERALDVAVAGGQGLAGAPPGTRVDVLITTESRSGAGGRTYLAIQDVELLGARPVDEGGGGAARASTLATLRVTVRQAVFLTAAQSFAREVRVLVRGPRDARGTGPIEVRSGDL